MQEGEINLDWSVKEENGRAEGIEKLHMNSDIKAEFWRKNGCSHRGVIAETSHVERTRYE